MFRIIIFFSLTLLGIKSFSQDGKYITATTKSGKVVRLYENKTWKMLKSDNDKVSFKEVYEVGAGFASGIFFKCSGSITISDKKVIITVNGETASYDFISKSNNTIYYTDGVQKFMFIKMQGKMAAGKKKGYTHTSTLVSSLVGNSTSASYYCNKQ